MSLSRACRLFGISHQGYYQKQQRINNRLQELAQVKASVVEERLHLPRLGTRKLYYRLKQQFNSQVIKLVRDDLFAFLRAENLFIRPWRSYHKTTNSKHWLRLHKYPNLLVLAGIKPERVNQVWVSDITYVDAVKQTFYLSLIIDACSWKIVGYHLHPSLPTDGVAAALQMAVKTENNNCH